jgi:hypothetical protein
MAELDVTGSKGYCFVTVTVFGDDGWVTDEDMWASIPRRPEEVRIGAFLAQLTAMPEDEADAVAQDFLETWRRRGGPDEDASLTRRFGFGVVGALVAVALLAALATWIVLSLVRRPPLLHRGCRYLPAAP